MAMKPPALEIARVFADQARERSPGQIKEIFFYGSRARGDDGPDSDYDLCIVVDHDDPALEDRIMELAVEWLDRYDAFIAPLLCAEQTFSRCRDAGLYREILREGVRL